jgi:hypothetical protein
VDPMSLFLRQMVENWAHGSRSRETLPKTEKNGLRSKFRKEL